MSEKKYEPAHFAFAGFYYTESLCNALVLKGVLSEKEKHVILQVAHDGLKSSTNDDIRHAAELIKDVNSHLTFD